MPKIQSPRSAIKKTRKFSADIRKKFKNCNKYNMLHKVKSLEQESFYECQKIGKKLRGKPANNPTKNQKTDFDKHNFRYIGS